MIAAESLETGFAPINAATGEELRLALQELRLAGRILPVGARLIVRHVFQSREKAPLEAIYAFRLPRDASLRRFRVVGEGFSVRSELKPVEEATRAYEAGIAAGRLSTMARAYRDGMINLSVGNIAPGETVSVLLEMVAGVESRDDGFRFRFPFTLAPTYHRAARVVAVGPGEGRMELPEEEFGDAFLPPWRADASALHAVGFDLRLCAAEAIDSVSSPSHPTCVRNVSATEIQVELAAGRDVPNRDLVLDVKTRTAYCGVLAGPDRQGSVRFAGVVPSSRFGAAEAGPRSVVFVLDRSGSMDGAPIRQARKAVEACLAALSAEDGFGIVAFDSTVEVFRADLALGTSDNRESARKFLAGIDARGGTELLAGIQAGHALLTDQGGDLLVVTDGQVAGTEDINRAVRQANTRIHCLGIGSASQDRFLTLLARETHGVCRFLSPRERVDMAAVELFAAAGRPVAEKVQCDAAGLPAASLMPAPPAVVFKGTPLVVFGSAKEAGEGRLVLRWERGGEARHLEVRFSPGDGGGVGETLRLLQGARLITDLENQITDAGPGAASERRRESRLWRALENLSREYGLASRGMSLVAVVERHSDQVGKVPTTRIVPVGLPEEMPFEAYFSPDVSLCCLAESAPAQVSPRRGQGIVAKMARPPESTSAGYAPRAARSRGRDDQLIEIASRLEPDGGMPGRAPEERLLASLLALVVLSEADTTSHPGTFALHIRRLRAFLESADLSALDKSRAEVVRAVLDVIDRALPIPPELSALALSRLARKRLRAKSTWQDLEKQARNMT